MSHYVSHPDGGSIGLRLALQAMGTRFELVLANDRDEHELRSAGESALEVIRDWHDRLSIFDRGSLVSRINREAHEKPVRIDRDMLDLFSACERWRAMTDGAFDIAVGSLMEHFGFRDTGATENVPPFGMDLVEIDADAMTVRFTEPGVKLDFRHFPDGYVATAADVEAELKRIGHNLQPLDIVVVNTSAGLKYGEADYVTSGCGMGYEATMYLLERGVRLTGIDGWSWDAPFVHTARKYAATHDAKLIWEGHKAGRHIGYCHIEKLHNLETLPATGFTISCFPVKIERASAGWTRAVAIIG